MHPSFIINATAPTKSYTLSHTTLFRSLVARAFRRVADQLDIAAPGDAPPGARSADIHRAFPVIGRGPELLIGKRSEEHTSELQSRRDIVCRLLLEKKKQILDRRCPIQL